MTIFSANAGPNGISFTSPEGATLTVEPSQGTFSIVKMLLQQTQTAFREGRTEEANNSWAHMAELATPLRREHRTPREELPPIGTRDERGYIEVGGGLKFHESLGIEVPLQTQDHKLLTRHRILPGSIEISDEGTISAGVHTGPTDFSTDNLRYVKGNMRKHGQPEETVGAFMGRIYDNSEGCLIRGDFRMTQPLPEREPEPAAKVPEPPVEHRSSRIIDLEIQKSERHRVLEFIEDTATSIAEGYGAGNCNPESVAFWSSLPKTDLKPDWFLIHIELDSDQLSDHEIAAAVRKVTDAPSGEIKVFGNVVGRWTTIEGKK